MRVPLLAPSVLFLLMTSAPMAQRGTPDEEPRTGAREEKSGDSNRPFLQERGSPLKAIQTGGFAVVLRNVGKKEILNWGEVCLARNGDKYGILRVFSVDVESPLKPGYAEGDSRGMDASPIVICGKYRGLLAVSEVQFVDGTSWKSRWLKAALPRAPGFISS